MKRMPLFVLSILALSLCCCIQAGAQTKTLPDTDNAITASAAPATIDGTDWQLPVNPVLSGVISYDYAKCIESCDNQYSACTKNGDAEKIKYCSNQHDKCRKACLEHK
jgi:hypothetical protein